MGITPRDRTSRHDVDSARRQFIRFGGKNVEAAVRPPWTRSAAFTDNCIRCDRCIAACPEHVLLRGDGGFPEFAPAAHDAACTFCGACAAACPEKLFLVHVEPALEAKAALNQDACLAMVGIHCECCRDACDERALRFRPRLGGPAIPELQDDLCNGCGACLSVCPNDALELMHTPRDKEAA